MPKISNNKLKRSTHSEHVFDDVRKMCIYWNIKKFRRTAKLSQKVETSVILMASSTTFALLL